MKQGVGWHWVRLSGPDSPYQGDALFGEIKCNTNYSLTFFLLMHFHSVLVSYVLICVPGFLLQGKSAWNFGN